MPLRHIQILLPDDRSEELGTFLEEHNSALPLGSWLDEESGVRTHSLLLHAYKADSLIEALLAQYREQEHFRLLVSEVVASLPDIEDEVEENRDEDKKEEKVERVPIEEVQEKLKDGGDLSIDYLIMVALSTIVAIVGMMKDNAPVVIGAMVIAPLLGPNMALALGTALGQWPSILKSLRTAAAGLVLAFLLSCLFGVIFSFSYDSDEILSRTTVYWSDVILALTVGAVGALAYTTALSATLVGVMVAVALLPPLVASGMLIGAGRMELGLQAALLTAINVVGINLAAVSVFMLKGIRPRFSLEAKRASGMSRWALALWVALLAGFIALMLWAAERSHEGAPKQRGGEDDDVKVSQSAVPLRNVLIPAWSKVAC